MQLITRSNSLFGSANFRCWKFIVFAGSKYLIVTAKVVLFNANPSRTFDFPYDTFNIVCVYGSAFIFIIYPLRVYYLSALYFTAISISVNLSIAEHYLLHEHYLFTFLFYHFWVLSAIVKQLKYLRNMMKNGFQGTRRTPTDVAVRDRAHAPVVSPVVTNHRPLRLLYPWQPTVAIRRVLRDPSRLGQGVLQKSELFELVQILEDRGDIGYFLTSFYSLISLLVRYLYFECRDFLFEAT